MKAIGRYVRKIRQQNPEAGARVRYGSEAAGVAMTGTEDNAPDRDLVPYREVSIDGHRIDAPITLEVDAGDGTFQDLPLERMWLLILLDIGSRAALGYAFSYAANYCTDDVMDCIGSSIDPWRPRELQSEVLRYLPGAGLPSGVIPECESRAFDSLSWDNHRAQLSEANQQRIIDTEGCHINTGRPANPFGRPRTERFFGTFAEALIHRLPFTTGSSPDDPRRGNPDKTAARLRFNERDLFDLADVTISNYNATPHWALNGRTPLDYIRWFDRYEFTLPRRVMTTDGGLALHLRNFAGHIAGDEKRGRRPYVRFMGVDYRSATLASSMELIKQPITIVANVKDLRVIEILLPNGQSLGKLWAHAPWMLKAHSLRNRRAILKLMSGGTIFRESTNPVGDYVAYLEERARTYRRARNQLAEHQRLPQDPIAADGEPERDGSEVKATEPIGRRITVKRTLDS
jgi:hypothetical protein